MLIALLFALLQVTGVTWKDAPASMPPGTKIAVLEGSPAQPGLFTIRLKLRKGAKVALHTHPRDERVTVLSGKVKVTIEGKTTTFTRGGFYVNPPGVPHSLSIEEETVLHLTCEGPWEVDYVGSKAQRLKGSKGSATPRFAPLSLCAFEPLSL